MRHSIRSAPNPRQKLTLIPFKKMLIVFCKKDISLSMKKAGLECEC